VAVRAYRSVPVVVDHLGTLAEVDPARIAITGRSTGGFVVLEALASEPRLALGLVRVACGDYHDFLQNSSLALAGNPRWLVDGKIVLDADYEAELREREPIRTAGRLPPRPLLMQNGGRDPAMPSSCALRTARVLERAYAVQGLPERFRFVLWDDRGHDLGQDAQAEETRWCERWLLEGR
jgi:dipeptidyl aminopeptidase/acylaminoacyl peptidase